MKKVKIEEVMAFTVAKNQLSAIRDGTVHPKKTVEEGKMQRKLATKGLLAIIRRDLHT